MPIGYTPECLIVKTKTNSVNSLYSVSSPCCSLHIVQSELSVVLIIRATGKELEMGGHGHAMDQTRIQGKESIIMKAVLGMAFNLVGLEQRYY